jgi:hypothetical protein
MAPRVQDATERDEGSILIMALILVTVFGVVIGSIATYAAVSFKHTSNVRAQTEMRASAEAGVRVTLDQLSRHQTLCADTSTPAPLTISPNAATVTVRCTNIGGANVAATNFAVLLTGLGVNGSYPSLLSSGGGTRKIGGGLYMAVPSSHSVSNLELQGDFWYLDSTCTSVSPPTISGMTITPVPPRTKICTTKTWQEIVPTILLPAKPTSVNPAGRDDLVSGCRIFYPGTYTSPPDLADQNYFVSGDYYFEFNDSFEIKQATIIGGNIDPTLGDTQYVSAPNCANARSVPAVGGAEDGYGNSWFLGKGAWIDVGTQGALEIFRRDQGTQEVSVMAVSSTSAGYSASTNVITSGTPILSTKSGSNNDLVIHGLINVPKAQVAFGNVSNSANAQALGGVVAAGIEMQSSASASGFVINRASIPAQTRLRITSTATDSRDISATVQAIVEYQPARFVNDGDVTNGSTTVTSATAAFTANDIGNRISGTGIPGSAKISSINSATSASISVAATASATATRLVIETPQVAVNSWRKV